MKLLESLIQRLVVQPAVSASQTTFTQQIGMNTSQQTPVTRSYVSVGITEQMQVRRVMRDLAIE